MKYRKKPVVIEAIKYDGTGRSLNSIREAFPDIVSTVSFDNEFVIQTLEGEHLASPGDFIIKGIKGEFYPCKPDIFEMTYEKVEE